jgi:hypothetical protein
LKLFQIEEPDGAPADPNASGAAVGIDASGNHVEVAFSVGGNALVLLDREGFEQTLPVPANGAETGAWQELLEGARMRAERLLGRPVTHAVIALAAQPDRRTAVCILEAAEQAGLEVLRLAGRAELAAGPIPVLAAAMLAEDLAPRPEVDAAPGSG